MKEYLFGIYRDGQYVKQEKATHHRSRENMYLFSRDADLKSGDEVVDTETNCKYKVAELRVVSRYDGESFLVKLKNI